MLPPDLGVGGLVLSGVVALLAGVAVEGLAVGSDHTCVLLDDGSVKCFGLNDYGQLGQGDKADRGASASDMGDSLLAVDFGTRSPAVVAMSAGSDHTCVIFFGGSMKCFGRNNKGQLGHGNRYDRGDDALEMGDNLETVDLGDNRTAVAVAAEGDRTCALLDTGDVRCWGDGEHGALGTGDEKHTGDGKRDIADSVDLGVGTSAITAIGSGPCAITEDGVMKCWGKGYYGQNGQGTADNAGDLPGEMGDALATVPLGTGNKARSVVGGRDFMCAVLQDGALKCWGRGEGGQLGNEDISTIGDDPDEMGNLLPTVNLGSHHQPVLEVSAGIQHVCALLVTGGVKCWGKNFYGNLGLGDFTASISDPGLHGGRALYCPLPTTCGTCLHFYRGKKGHAPGTMGNSLPEVDLGTGRTAVSLKAGGERTCAILDNGSLKCWGYNVKGQLGLGDKDAWGPTEPIIGDSLPTVQLGTGRTAVALATGSAIPTEAPAVTPVPLPTESPIPGPTPVPTHGPTVTLAAPTPTPLVPSAPTSSPFAPSAPTIAPVTAATPTTAPNTPAMPTTMPSAASVPDTPSPFGPVVPPTPSPSGLAVTPTPSPLEVVQPTLGGATTPSPSGGGTRARYIPTPTGTPSPSFSEGGGAGVGEYPGGGTVEPSLLSPTSMSSSGGKGTDTPAGAVEDGDDEAPSAGSGAGADGIDETASPEVMVDVDAQGSSAEDSTARTTIVASIATPLAILVLLGCWCLLARRGRRGAAAVAAKPDDAVISPHGSMHGSVFGEENAVGDSQQSTVV